MVTDYQNYFDLVPEGTVLNWASGVLTRTPYGAIFSGPSGTVSLSPESDLNKIAYDFPEIESVWNYAYGFSVCRELRPSLHDMVQIGNNSHLVSTCDLQFTWIENWILNVIKDSVQAIYEAFPDRLDRKLYVLTLNTKTMWEDVPLGTMPDHQRGRAFDLHYYTFGQNVTQHNPAGYPVTSIWQDDTPEVLLKENFDWLRNYKLIMYLSERLKVKSPSGESLKPVFFVWDSLHRYIGDKVAEMYGYYSKTDWDRAVQPCDDLNRNHWKHIHCTVGDGEIV
jgi:hypothetical protein